MSEECQEDGPYGSSAVSGAAHTHSEGQTLPQNTVKITNKNNLKKILPTPFFKGRCPKSEVVKLGITTV